MVIGIFRRSSIDDRQLLASIDKERFSLSDLNRRAKGLKEEISQIFGQENSLTVAEKMHVAETKIHAFHRLIEEVLDLSSPQKNELGKIGDQLKNFIKDQALESQTKKLESAFQTFLQLEEAKEYLQNTFARWRAMSARDVIQEELSIPHFSYLIGKRIDQRKKEFQEEVNVLSSLMGRETTSNSLQEALPKELLNKPLGILAGRVDHFLKDAEEVRSLAQKMATAKSSIQRGWALIDEIQSGDLAALERFYLQLKSKIEQYDLSDLEELFEDFSTLLERTKVKISGEAGIVPIAQNFAHLQGDNFNFLYTGIWNDLNRLSDASQKLKRDFTRFKQLETRFLERNFQELTLASFERVPDKLYARLKEIILQKLAPLFSKGHTAEEIDAARSYKKAVRAWLKQMGTPSIFKMKELKLTWGEQFRSFLSWIASLFTRSRPQQPPVVNEGEGLLAYYRRRSIAEQA